MARAIIENVVIFDEGLYHSNGLVGKWCTLITRHFAEHAIEEAPDGPPRPDQELKIKEGIHWDSHQIGVRQVEGTISSLAPHTMYVIGGTTGPIRSTLGWSNPGGAFGINPRTGKFGRMPGYWLHVHAGYGRPERVAFSVGGQRPNNFLLKAWRATARNHRAIRNTTPQFLANL